MKRLTLIAIILLTTAVGFNIQAQKENKRVSVTLKHGAHRIGKRTDADMQRWREHGLGQFIHWGVYSIPGGQWNGEIYKGVAAAEGIRYWGDANEDGKYQKKTFDGVSWTKIYDEFYKQFDPKDFDAKKWARQAKEMGAKYVIFTTKHHDGFCMWPTQYTDYNISNTPYQKDIVGQVVEAYMNEGIDVFLYFSILDWHFKGNYEELKKFTWNQLMELADRYPKVKGFWFDGTWLSEWKKQAVFADSIEQELKNRIPGLIIGSRLRPDENGNTNFDTNGDLMGDYDQTWERSMPNSIEELSGNDWDCAMTIPETQWGYQSDWSWLYVKSSHEMIELLAQAVSMDGNLVVNFGPDSKGMIRPEETKVAKDIGDWMKINSEAIYGVKHINLKKQDWGYYTQKGDKIYMLVFNRPLNNMLRVDMGKESAFLPVKAYFIENKVEVPLTSAGLSKHKDKLYNVTLAKEYISEKPFVIVLNTEKVQSDK